MNGDRQLRHSEIREFFDRIAPERENWIGKNAYFYESDAAYMRFSVPEGLSVLEVGCGTGHLLALLKPSRGVGVDISPAMLEHARAKHPELEFVCGDIEDEDLQARLKGPFDVIVMSDLVGYLDDCQALFSALRRLLAPRGRIVIVYYNRWWQPLLRAGEKIGLKMPSLAQNWLTTDDLANLLDLAGLQPIRREWRMLLPRRLLGLGVLVNRLIAPLPFIRRMCVRNFVVARSRPEVVHPPSEPSVSVLIPCRNERGNIEAAVRRLPRFAPDMEVIFAEGNSSDGTFEECERVRDTNREWDIKVIKQPGKGKGDAVRAGFAVARGSILMILDCDLSVPPEALPKFYDVLRQGQGEYAHGTRLIYKMEKAAMRPLNFVANRGFAMILGYLINQRVTDTLCGTKVLWRIDYDRVVANRAYFGEFDPFGDFDLLFGAAKLGLKIVEVPVRYASRTYGETQISRFSDGFLLLWMVVFAWRKFKAL
jgi:SAM-dependent methyltransferase